MENNSPELWYLHAMEPDSDLFSSAIDLEEAKKFRMSIIDEIDGRIHKCACSKHPIASLKVIKENGQETPVCHKCANWWKRVDPSITLVTI